jgi:negative regulator of flagellin synthesis FlgM
MKVSNITQKNIQGIGNKPVQDANKRVGDKQESAEAKIAPSGSAKVQLSERMKQINKAKEIVASTPDVDEAKVAKFRALIDQGKYNVDAEKVADRLVDESILVAPWQDEE